MHKTREEWANKSSYLTGSQRDPHAATVRMMKEDIEELWEKNESLQKRLEIKFADDDAREKADQELVLAHWRLRFPNNMYAPPGVPSEWALEAVRALSPKVKP